ncbi:MAG: hypothetical protein ACLSE4_04180 [Clostridium sp.]
MESSAGYGFLSDIDIKRYLKDGSIKIETMWHDELAFNPEKTSSVRICGFKIST